MGASIAKQAIKTGIKVGFRAGATAVKGMKSTGSKIYKGIKGGISQTKKGIKHAYAKSKEIFTSRNPFGKQGGKLFKEGDPISLSGQQSTARVGREVVKKTGTAGRKGYDTAQQKSINLLLNAPY